MANDGVLAMHAVLKGANGRSNPKGIQSYKLTFAFPVGFLSAVAEFLGEKVDIHWDETQIATDADVVSVGGKPVKDEDPQWTVVFDADPAESGLINGIAELDAAGDLRLVAKQMSMSLTPRQN